MANELKDLIADYATDIDAIYQDFEDDKQQIGENIGETAVRAAFEQLQETRKAHFDEMMARTKQFLTDLKGLAGN